MLEDIPKRLSEKETDYKNTNLKEADEIIEFPSIEMEYAQFRRYNTTKNVLRLELSNFNNNLNKVDEEATPSSIKFNGNSEIKETNNNSKDFKNVDIKIETYENVIKLKSDPNNENKNVNLKEDNVPLIYVKMENLLESTWFIILMTILTIYAMFATDIQAAFVKPNADWIYDIIDCILFAIFSIEIIIASISKKNYLFTFFFWLDVISTLSLLQDMSFTLEKILTGYDSFNLIGTFNDQLNSAILLKTKSSTQAANSIQKLSSATRATRVLKIIRIARLIRIVKLYKSAIIARAKIERRKQENERQKALKAALEVQTLMEQNANSPNRKSLASPLKNTVLDNLESHHEMLSPNQKGIYEFTYLNYGNERPKTLLKLHSSKLFIYFFRRWN